MNKKTLYYDSNKQQLTIGDCASGDLQPVIVQPTLASDTFRISEDGYLYIKIDGEYSKLDAPSLIGPSGGKGEKGEKGDSPQIEIRTSNYQEQPVRCLYVNGVELQDVNGDGAVLLREDEVLDLYELINKAAQTPATASLDDPLSDLNEIVQQQAQQIEDLQVSLTEATARIAALEADTAWLKELNKEEMLQYWSVKTTTEE